MDRDEALRLFLRQQLMPLVKRNQLSRAVRLFNWEMLKRTDIFQKLIVLEPIPILTVAQGIVGKFLPGTASPEERTIALIWLVNQAYIFVRDYEHLAKPPTNLAVAEDLVERLIDMLARMLAAALIGLHRPRQQKGPAGTGPRLLIA
jgi:hypothetical protein